MRTRLLIGVVLAGLAATVGVSTSLAAGYSPGLSPNGVLSPSGHVRYLAVSAGHTTRVKAVHAPGGQVMRTAALRGVYGIPLVTYDGTAGGLTRDGKMLVLSTVPGNAADTRFLVIDTRTLKIREAIHLNGIWAFDALSPDGSTMYLIQYVPTEDALHYVVRAYDLRVQRLVTGAIADKSEPGPMTGLPMSRATTPDGTWAYTLYDRGDGRNAFIHALNTSARVAVCVDIDLPISGSAPGDLHLTLSADQRQLIVRGADGKTLKTVSAPR